MLLLAAGLGFLLTQRARAGASAGEEELRFETAEDGALRVYDGTGPRSDVNGIVRDHESGIWRLVRDGAVETDYTGFYNDGGTWWYVDAGRVAFEKNGVLDAPENGARWYVLGGRAMTDFSGLTRAIRGLPAMMLENGVPDESYTGFARNADGWWYVKNGAVDTALDGLLEGRVDGADGLWYVVGGKAQPGWNGFLPEADGKTLRLIESGHTAPERTGIVRDGGRWRYVENGLVDLGARRVMEYDGSRWVLLDGCAWRVTNVRARMLCDAMELLKTFTDESMTREEMLRASFDNIKGRLEGVSRSPHDTSMEWPEIYAADIFEGEGGNCFSFAAAFAYLARACGYTEVYVLNSGGHGWAEVDGLIYDPERAANSYTTSYYAFSYEYAEDYARTLESSKLEGNEWKRIKIFDEDRESS